MKILFFTDTFLPSIGGAEMVLNTLAVRMQMQGHRLTVLAPQPKQEWDDKRLGYPVVRYRKPISKRWGTRIVLLNMLALHQRERFDIVHCHSSYPAAYVANSFQKLTGVPYVVRPHGTDIMPARRIRGDKRLERRLQLALRQANAVIAQGSFLYGLIKGLGVSEDSIHILHNGVDLQRYQTYQPFPHERDYLLAVGGLKQIKGFDVLLKAYGRLDNPTLDLFIAGTGADEQKLKQLAIELGIASRVHFLGYVDGQRKIDMYRSAQCLVCPSRIESFSNVILESLAAGLPVVASEVGGNPELVHHGRHGLLFPSEDEAALATTLHILMSDAELYQRLKSAVPEFIAQFDWSHVVGRYLKLYKQQLPLHQSAA